MKSVPIRSLLLLAFTALLIASTQAPPISAQSNESVLKPALVDEVPAAPVRPFEDGSGAGTFVLYADERGNRVCRDATPEEAAAVAKRAPNLVLREIPGIRPNQASGLRIVLRGTPQLDNFPDARRAFQNAAAQWESLITTPITVIVDVDFGPTRFGTPWQPSVIGSTGVQNLITGYGDVRSRLVQRAATPQRQAFFNLLPPDFLATDIGPATQVQASSALFRALGVINPNADPAGEQTLGSPPSIGFNSNLPFDFDPANGIDADKIDFTATALHEIGHALGFISGVGLRELSPTAPIAPSVWDLFRFRPGLSPSNFTSEPRVLSSGGAQSFLNLQGSQIPLSTGRPNGTGGDNQQASHWQRRDFAGGLVGIMDPVGVRGGGERITTNDLIALDTFGYSISQAVPPLDRSTPTITNVSPNGGESFSSGNPIPISWTITNLAANTRQNITLSRDGGQTFTVPIATGVLPSVRSFTWETTDNLNGNSFRIRISANGPAFFVGSTASSGNFSVGFQQPPPPPTPTFPPPTTLTASVSNNTVALNWRPPTGFAPGAAEADQVFASILRPTGLAAGPVAQQMNLGFTFQNPATSIVFGQQLTPTSYPATLKKVFFLSANSLITRNGQALPSAVGARFRLIVFNAPTRPTLISPQNLRSQEVTIAREASSPNISDPSIEGPSEFNEFVIPDYTIQSGSFYVGLQLVSPGTSQIGASGENYSFLARGLETNPNSSSFVSPDGGTSFIGLPLRLAFGGTTGSRDIDFPFLGQVEAAQPGGARLTGYSVYRSTSAGVTVTQANRIATLPATVTQFTDSPTPANGAIRYFYVVTANYDTGNESVGSNETSAVPGNVPPPADTTPPTVRLVTPNGGELIDNGAAFTISWVSSDNLGVVSHSIDLSTNGGTSFGTSIATGLAGNVQSFAFNVPATLETTTGRIRVTARDAAGNQGSAVSATNFSIRFVDRIAPTVNILTPNGGERARAGTTLTINWIAADNVGVDIQEIFLSTDGGATFPTRIVGGLAGNVRTFNFVIPATQGRVTAARVRITVRDRAGNSASSTSANNFRIRRAE